MKHALLNILVLVALLVGTGTAMAQGNPPPDLGVQVVAPFTVRIAVPVEDGSTDPIDPAYYYAAMLPLQLFSGLTRIDPATHAPVGDLAQGWTSNADKTQFTFTLRSGLKWSNGVAITATDVKNSLLRTLKPSTGSDAAYELYNIMNAEKYHNGSVAATRVGITVLNPTQIKFTLNGSAAYFPANLATPPALLVPTSVIAAWGSAWTQPAHIVSSGPYKLTQWAHYDHFTLDKNPNFYAAGSVKVQHILARQLDEASAWASFIAGALDTVTVPWGEFTAAKADPGLSPLLHMIPTGCNYYYGFSVSQAPFDDPLVRKAFIAAINRQGLLDAQFAGSQWAAQTFTPPGFFGHLEPAIDDVGIPYNVSEAQAYLAASTYSAGLPTINLWYNDSTGHAGIANYVESNWETNLGANVIQHTLPWNDYLTQLETGAFPVWRMGWCSDYNDAYNWLNDAIVPGMAGRYGGWSNSSYTGLLSQAAAAADNAARLDFYKQAETILTETDAVVIPLYHNNSAVVTRAYLSRNYGVETYVRDWVLNTTTSTLTSGAAEDGWILESGENSNVGSTPNSIGTTLLLGDNAQDKQYRAVLSFDTSGLPDNAIITSVTLKIKGAGTAGTNPFTTHGSLLADVRTGAWSGDPVLQALDFQASASKTAALTIKSTPVSGWYSGTMPAASLGYINKAGVTQFRLRFAKDDNDDLGADYLKLFSGNALDPTAYPQLIIKYYAP